MGRLSHAVDWARYVLALALIGVVLFTLPLWPLALGLLALWLVPGDAGLLVAIVAAVCALRVAVWVGGLAASIGPEHPPKR